MAGVWNWVIEQGAMCRAVLRLRDESGQPMNLAGCTARMQIRPQPRSSELLHELTSDSGGGIEIGETEGTLTLTVAPETSLTFTWRNAVYDLLLIDPGGEPTRVLKGSVMIDPAVTA